MEELELKTLVVRAQTGDSAAYETIVRRFQDMAVGYAYALLGDIDTAEDAAQEAFIDAYYALPALREPAAFPGWFRRVVFKQYDRIRRSQKDGIVSLESVSELPAAQPGPAELAERHEVQTQVRWAIQSLPEHQRAVVTLFYISAYSQREISQFLEIPEATVKTRLHHARKRLKEKIVIMLQNNLPDQRPSRDDTFTGNVMRLFKATVGGDIETVRTLLTQDPALARAVGLEWSAIWHGEVPALHVAVMYNRKDIIDLLLANGADINERDKTYGWTVLHQAIDLGFLPEYDSNAMLAFLLSRGARKDIFVPLWLGDVEGVSLFLEQDPALANARGPMYATPLCFASTVELATLLLDHGADLYAHVPNEKGFDHTPIQWAVGRLGMFVKPDVFLLLLDRAGVEIDIFLACVLSDLDKVSALLTANPSLVHTRTGRDHVLQPDLTPLHIAARHGYVAIARRLMDAGADVNARAPAIKNMTPLHLAVWQGPRDVLRLRPEMPRFLLEHGADITARDDERNETPLGWAEADDLCDEVDRREVAALLREFGATE